MTSEALRAAITPKTKALILCSPSNPTGSAYTGEQLRALADVAAEHNFWIIVDEIYGQLVYGGFEQKSIAEVAPDSDRFRAGVQLLWETYADPTHAAVLELYIAARTDPELRETLRELGRRHQKHVLQRANEYFPELARADASGLFEMIQAALTGLAVQRMVYGDRVRDDQVLDLIERMVKQTFGATTSRHEELASSQKGR